jgi:uncharacterized integral membrane protein
MGALVDAEAPLNRADDGYSEIRRKNGAWFPMTKHRTMTASTSSETESVTMSEIPHEEPEAGASSSVAPTRVSASWTAVVVAAFVLVLLIIFIAQNTQHSSVNFLWLHGKAPTSVVLLIAATAGALVVIIVAVARILQLRRAASHSEPSAPHSEPSAPHSEP